MKLLNYKKKKIYLFILIFLIKFILKKNNNNKTIFIVKNFDVITTYLYSVSFLITYQCNRTIDKNELRICIHHGIVFFFFKILRCLFVRKKNDFFV